MNGRVRGRVDRTLHNLVPGPSVAWSQGELHWSVAPGETIPHHAHCFTMMTIVSQVRTCIASNKDIVLGQNVWNPNHLLD